MRRVHIIIGALALVAAACSGGEATPSSTTTTTFLVTTTTTTPPSTMVAEPESSTSLIEVWAPAALVGPLTDAASAFEIDTGIDVEVEAADPETAIQQLLEDPEDGPDVYVAPHSWLIDLTDAGAAEPLSMPPEVVGAAAAAVQLRTFSYAIPIGLDTIAQFRNHSLLTTSPTTIESFAEGCPGGPCLALSPESVEGHWPFMAGLGGYLFGPHEYDGWDKDDVGLDTADAVAAGLILESIVDGAGILGDGSTTARDRFVAGEAPLFWGTTADLAAFDEAGMDVTVEPLPTIGDQAAVIPVSVTALWVNAFSVDKEAARRLVEGYLTTPENAATLAAALGLAPVDAGFDADPDLAAFTRGAVAGDPIPPIDATELAWVELADAFSSMRDGLDAQTAYEGAAANIRAGA